MKARGRTGFQFSTCPLHEKVGLFGGKNRLKIGGEANTNE
jgi:hypothetical protein